MTEVTNGVDANFGARFGDARRAAGVSQEAVVKAVEQFGVKLHLTAIGKIERGERRVTVGEALALSSAIGYTLEGVIGIGESTLVTQGALVGVASTALQRAVKDYAEAVLALSAAADQLETPPRDNQHDFLTVSIPDQTPAMLARDAKYAIEAAIQRKGITPGRYVNILLDAVDRDEAALAAVDGESHGSSSE